MLAPNSLTTDGFAAPHALQPAQNENQVLVDRHASKGKGNLFSNAGGMNIGAVVGGMEASGVCAQSLQKLDVLFNADSKNAYTRWGYGRFC